MFNLEAQHPQLKDKAVVDLLNNIDVQKDRITLHQRLNKNIFKRALNGLNGKNSDNVEAMMSNVNQQFSAVSALLEDMTSWRINSDKAVAQIAKRAGDLSVGFMRLQERVDTHQEDITKISDHLASLGQRCNEQFEQVFMRLDDLDMYREASDQFEHVISKWEAGQFQQYTPFQKLYVVADELRWGRYGAYIRKLTKEQRLSERTQKLQTLHNKLAALFKQASEFDYAPYALFSTQKVWLESAESLDAEPQECLTFLSDWAGEKHQPLTWAMNQTLLGENTDILKCERLPKAISAPRFVDRLVNEQLEVA